jgi:hypothetical protein
MQEDDRLKFDDNENFDKFNDFYYDIDIII